MIKKAGRPTTNEGFVNWTGVWIPKETDDKVRNEMNKGKTKSFIVRTALKEYFEKRERGDITIMT